MDITRRVGGVVLIVAAVAMLFLGLPMRGESTTIRDVMPTRSTVNDVNGDIESVLSDASANDAAASGAPQQTVVAEWAIKDLAAIIARQQNDRAQHENELAQQQNDLARQQNEVAQRQDQLTRQQIEVDNRNGGLLALLIVGLAFALLTLRSPRNPSSAALTGYPVPPRQAGPVPPGATAGPKAPNRPSE